MSSDSLATARVGRVVVDVDERPREESPDGGLPQEHYPNAQRQAREIVKLRTSSSSANIELTASIKTRDCRHLAVCGTTEHFRCGRSLAKVGGTSEAAGLENRVQVGTPLRGQPAHTFTFTSEPHATTELQ